MTIEDDVRQLAQRARDASVQLAQTTTEERNAALAAMADALRSHADEIIEANERDMSAARESGTTEAILDRLMLNEDRLEDMAVALEDLMDLPDPVGCIQKEDTLYNGIELQRISVPLGVVAIVYEARPNVGADAAGICIKSGNACILRGGSLAQHSNEVIARVLAEAAQDAGMPPHCIEAILTTNRAATDALMQLHGLVDVLIPRGGVGLIRHCVETSKVPVIETGTGNCHVYVHESADFDIARSIVLNAKCRRFGVCNAAETLLVDASIARAFLPQMLTELAERGVTLHCDETARECAYREIGSQMYGSMTDSCEQDFRPESGSDTGGLATTIDLSEHIVPATEEDWATEYLAPEIAVKCVSGLDEAIAHINRYGTHHSEAIVATDVDAIERFLAQVDASAVYANASTAFTDGGQFGLGAEIGISTQKLHARGPFALDALTSYKYVLRGNGQVRA